MCPGGYVVNASSEPGRLAVNGMSYHDRAGENANSAIIVTVTPEDFCGMETGAGTDQAAKRLGMPWQESGSRGAWRRPLSAWERETYRYSSTVILRKAVSQRDLAV